MIELSSRAKRVLESLDENQKRVIRKENPFRRDRNHAIRRLRARGVGTLVLVEITGLSVSMIKQITSKSRTTMADEALRDLQIRFEMFCNSVLEVLNKTTVKGGEKS